MNDLSQILEGISHIVRAEVVGSTDDAVVHVCCTEESEPKCCDVLVTGPTALKLHAGDSVLCWFPGPESTRGVVLGLIERHASTRDPEAIPETLVIEAVKSLTLRVGDGSITIREDGKILIKGKDLVSHAKRLNRIRGGSVQIN
jgi:hypothetical protein